MGRHPHGGSGRRALRALERQLDYQTRKARALTGREASVAVSMARTAHALRSRLEGLHPLPPRPRVLEVGSGAHGLIFFFGGTPGVGVDPLAWQYASLFPAWQREVPTIAAVGESLPFRDAAFDVVLSDNVVDHAEDPRLIVREIARVLRPGGLLYFTVHVHHPLYAAAATLHSWWRTAGVPLEIGPFADHTVHFTAGAARRLFDGLPYRMISEQARIAEAKAVARQLPPRHAADRLKRLFFKNALFEAIAVRCGHQAAAERPPDGPLRSAADG